MYKNRRVFITGGLGFIGSNLAVRLVHEGARVTIVDSLVPGCGGNSFNIHPVRNKVKLITRDLADAEAFAQELTSADIIFNLAGEVSHTMSMVDPERDLQLNTLAQLRFLRVCSRAAPGVRIVYASTRQVYGRPRYVPVDEAHPIDPIDFNGVHKALAAQYHMLLSRRGELSATVLCLSNVYGPRMALNLRHQGFLGTFLHNALSGEPLVVYGDGSQLRDPVYVDDVVEAFLLAGASNRSTVVYNVGGPQPICVDGIAAAVAAACGASDCVQRPFPEALGGIDIGSYWSDTELIWRELTWRPHTSFEEGIERTVGYYSTHRTAYMTPSNPEPCLHPDTPRERSRGARV